MSTAFIYPTEGGRYALSLDIGEDFSLRLIGLKSQVEAEALLVAGLTLVATQRNVLPRLVADRTVPNLIAALSAS